VKGTSQHSSEKIKDNAITKAAQIAIALEQNGFNVGKIAGGESANVVPDFCQLKFSTRTYEKYTDVASKINAIIEKYQGAALRNSFIGSPLAGNMEFPYLNQEMHEVDFWTEAAILQEVGISSVVMGAGSIKQAHSKDEYVEKKELASFEQILMKMFQELT